MRRRIPLLLLLWTGLLLALQTRPLTILHTNDLHAKLLPLSTGQGGFAHLATVIRRERDNCDHCLLLDGGDLAQGSPVSTIFRGLPVYQIANLFRFDASTIGNHDLDYGWKLTRRFIQTARFPIVSANLADPVGRLLAKQAYVILKVNGIRVAVIGGITQTLPSLSTPELLGPWRAQPLVETVRSYAAAVKERADLTVLLAHITATEEDEVLRTAPEVAVVVSGHSHSGIPAPSLIDGRIMVRVRSYGQELGRLDLQVDVPNKKVASWSWKRIPVDSKTVPPDAEVAREVARWEARISKTVDVPIAKARRRLRQADLKPLIEQAMAEHTGADLAFMNLGGIRDIIPEGTVLARHVWNVMPFDNRVLTGKFMGSQLPPAVSRGRPIDPQRHYALAVPDFVAVNQTEMGASGLTFSQNGPLLRDVLIEWIKKRKILD